MFDSDRPMRFRKQCKYTRERRRRETMGTRSHFGRNRFPCAMAACASACCRSRHRSRRCLRRSSAAARRPECSRGSFRSRHFSGAIDSVFGTRPAKDGDLPGGNRLFSCRMIDILDRFSVSPVILLSVTPALNVTRSCLSLRKRRRTISSSVSGRISGLRLIR